MSDDWSEAILTEKAAAVANREAFVDFAWRLAASVHEAPEEWGCTTVDEFLSRLSKAVAALRPANDGDAADEPTWGHLAELFLAALRK